jgi:very-short-patch-repair endonuclease
VDFVCLDKKLVVELDGGQHSEHKAYDDKRASWLQSEGFTILRFWDHEVLTQIGDVKQAISDALDATPSFVLPRKRGR